MNRTIGFLWGLYRRSTSGWVKETYNTWNSDLICSPSGVRAHRPPRYLVCRQHPERNLSDPTKSAQPIMLASSSFTIVPNKDVRFIEFFAGVGNVFLGMQEHYRSLRFDIVDHEAPPGRSNFMDFAASSGFASFS